MALWLTAVLALACLGGLAAPGPVLRSAAPSEMPLRELIEELINITQDQRVSNTHTHTPLPGARGEQAESGPVCTTEEAPSPQAQK